MNPHVVLSLGKIEAGSFYPPKGMIVKNRHALILTGLLIAASAAPAAANNAPPSDESIRQLLELTDARKLVDAAKAQVNTMVTASMQEAAQGKTLTPQQQAAIEKMHSEMMQVVDQMLNWDALLPMYIRIYRQSFTQDELDGMTAFYKTPTGQAMIKKMPVVMQNLFAEMQAMLKPMQQKIQQIQQETMHELKKDPGG
jgi:uncharacterized protein